MWGEKEKEKTKKDERKDTKNCQNPESKCFQSSRHGSSPPSFLPSFPACHDEETIPAALLQAALACTGLIWEAKAFQQ